MIRKYLLIVERDADICFLKHYIKHLIPSLEEDSKDKKNSKLKNAEIEIKFMNIKGFTNLATNALIIRQHKSENFKLLVVFDTDGAETHKNHHGGREKRLKYLEEQKNEIEIQFDTFLFPFNNEEEGDLETLLQKLVIKDKFNSFIKCYDSYCDCIRSLDPSTKVDEIRNPKNQIFSYVQISQGMENANEKKRDYSLKELWNLDAEDLNNLRIFLKNNGIVK